MYISVYDRHSCGIFLAEFKGIGKQFCICCYYNFVCIVLYIVYSGEFLFAQVKRYRYLDCIFDDLSTWGIVQFTI